MAETLGSPSMRRRGLLLLACALSACGGGDDVAVAPAGDLAADAFSVVVPSVGGDDVDLAGYAGRDLVLWFWSPW
jgi:hypothetical protein